MTRSTREKGHDDIRPIIAAASGAHSPIAKVLSHWQSLGGCADVPTRSAFDPSGVKQVLDHCFILERVTRETARFRVVGGLISKVVGHDLRGLPLSALVEYETIDVLDDALAHVFGSSSPALVQLKDRQSQRRCDMVLLPMTSDFGDVSRVLGALEFVQGAGWTGDKLQAIKVSSPLCPNHRSRECNCVARATKLKRPRPEERGHLQLV